MKTALLFLATFALGAALALGVRTLRHDPHAIPGGAEPRLAAAAPDHAGHAAPASATTEPATGTVNTVCPICAMEVDPSLPPATYQGKQVGFGCAACPPRFARDPDRWGPYALRKEVAP